MKIGSERQVVPTAVQRYHSWPQVGISEIMVFFLHETFSECCGNGSPVDMAYPAVTTVEKQKTKIQPHPNIKS